VRAATTWPVRESAWMCWCTTFAREEAILQAYPSIGSLAKAYGAITSVLEHPEAVEAYLAEQDALWKKLREEHQLPDEMQDRFRQTQNTRV